MTNNKTIELNANVFIIPNNATKVENFFFPEKQLEKMKEICSWNGVKFNVDDKLVSIWVTDDIHDNIIDHGIKVEGGYYVSYLGRYLSYIPEKLLPKKEGETVSILLKDMIGENYKLDEEVKFDIKFNLTANQLDYRYRNFGKFEDVLARVCC